MLKDAVVKLHYWANMARPQCKLIVFPARPAGVNTLRPRCLEHLLSHELSQFGKKHISLNINLNSVMN
jgi:hypothetical protein